MKKLIIFIVLLVTFNFLFCLKMIEFDKLEHDFGQIAEEKGPYEHTFHFTNTGDEPFTLIKVKAG